MKLAIDWSHTKDLTTYDGKKVKFHTKGHIHNAALNRTATFLAKKIFSHNTKEDKL